jgi:hypothetical protein
MEMTERKGKTTLQGTRLRAGWHTRGPAWRNAVRVLVCLGVGGGLAVVVAAESPGPPPTFATIDREVQGIKREILEINQELSRLEDELLYPARQRLTVFLSLTGDTPIQLELLDVALNGETLVRHRYRDAEVAALRQGGVQKPYVGKIEPGSHLLQAQLTGKDAGGHAFRLATSVRFAKGPDTKYVELRVANPGSGRSPELSIEHW